MVKMEYIVPTNWSSFENQPSIPPAFPGHSIGSMGSETVVSPVTHPLDELIPSLTTPSRNQDTGNTEKQTMQLSPIKIPDHKTPY